MKITYDLILRRLNRFEEVGGFDMKCLKKDFDTEEEALLYLANLLANKKPSEFDDEFKRYIFMSDEKFDAWHRFKAKALISMLDLKYVWKENSI